MPKKIDSGLSDWLHDQTRDDYRVVIASVDSYFNGTVEYGYHFFSNRPHMAFRSNTPQTFDAANIIEADGEIVSMPSIDMALDIEVSAGHMDVYSESKLDLALSFWVGGRLHVSIGDADQSWAYENDYYSLFSAFITGVRPIRRNVYRFDLVHAINIINNTINYLVAPTAAYTEQTFTGTARSILRDIWENYRGLSTNTLFGPLFHSSVPTALSDINMELTVGPFGDTQTFYDLSLLVKSVLPGVEIRNILLDNNAAASWEFFIPDLATLDYRLEEDEIIGDITCVDFQSQKKYIRVFYGDGPRDYKQAETIQTHINPFMPRSIRDLEINKPPLVSNAGYGFHQTLADNYAEVFKEHLLLWQIKVDPMRVPFLRPGATIRARDGARVVVGYVRSISYKPLEDYTIEVLTYE